MLLSGALGRNTLGRRRPAHGRTWHPSRIGDSPSPGEPARDTFGGWLDRSMDILTRPACIASARQRDTAEMLVDEHPISALC
jgi:hypothetical protein